MLRTPVLVYHVARINKLSRFIQADILLLLAARDDVQDSTINRNDLSVGVAVSCEIEKRHAHLLVSPAPLCWNMPLFFDLLCG